MPLSAVLTAVCLATGQPLPPVPELALASFPSSARDALARVHLEASKRPSDSNAVGTLGRWLQAWEQWQSAHQSYARAQALAPDTFDWQYLDAIVLQRLAQHAEAAARLRRALAIRPAYLPARVKLAEALLDDGDLKGSKVLFEKITSEPAAEPAAQLGLGRIAALEGRHDVAITHFERAIALFPEFGAAHYALARSYRAAGRQDDARRALGAHARHGARWPAIDDPVLAAVTGLRDDARAILRKGIASADAGDVESAIAEHEAALVRDPSLVQAHANLLSLYGRTKNWPKAHEHYRAAMAAGFTTADLHYDYGVVLGLEQKWEAAEEAYRRAIAANPLHAQARNNLGQLLERRDVAAATSEYQRALEAQPSFRLARFNLGRMFLAIGKAPEALAEFDKLQQPVDAETPRYLFALSAAYVRTGRKDQGIEMASRAQRLALEYGQSDLASAIARELAKLK